MGKRTYELRAEIEVEDDDEEMPLEALETDLKDVLSLQDVIDLIPYMIKVTSLEVSET